MKVFVNFDGIFLIKQSSVYWYLTYLLQLQTAFLLNVMEISHFVTFVGNKSMLLKSQNEEKRSRQNIFCIPEIAVIPFSHKAHPYNM